MCVCGYVCACQKEDEEEFSKGFFYCDWNIVSIFIDIMGENCML